MATKWAAKMMFSDWQNCFKVYWKDVSVQGDQLTSFCPNFPDNSIMHTGDSRGNENVRKAVVEAYRNIPKDQLSDTAKKPKGKNAIPMGLTTPTLGKVLGQ
jgi:hypothetical protein